MASDATTPAGDNTTNDNTASERSDVLPSTPHAPAVVSSGDAERQPSSAAAPQLTRTPTSSASSPTARLRSASIKLMHADPPLGMWAATGSTVSQAPTLGDIRRGTFHHDEGWNHDRVIEHHRSRASTTSSATSRLSRQTSGFSVGKVKRKGTGLADVEGAIPSVEEHDEHHEKKQHEHKDGVQEETAAASTQAPGEGYTPPPKLPWKVSFKIALWSFWKWFLTPLGFCITIYGLNVVAWGGMLFLLLCNAAPAMCNPDCNDINSPRRIWIEIDSQILNALFCVTGFGLIPWRFRDLYWLMTYRGVFTRKKDQRTRGLRMLAGIHRNWFRLSGSDKWQTEGDESQDEHNPAVPLPLTKRLAPPLTGVRAPPTSTWRLDYVIWMNVWNTFFQAVLCGFMWGMDRYNRPSWSTGLFVAIACVVAGLGGIMMGLEGKKVKKVEGVPPKAADILKHVELRVVTDPELLDKRQTHVVPVTGDQKSHK